MQVTKKPEVKTVTITPSESTHFRVILSSEAMENDTELEKKDAAASRCTIVKPEPRIPVAAVTPISPVDPDRTMGLLSPISPTEPLDMIPSSVATSTPANNQLTDSPSKKKGWFFVSHNISHSCHCS